MKVKLDEWLSALLEACRGLLFEWTCQGESPKGWVTWFGIQGRHWLGCHAGRSTLPKTDRGGKPSKSGSERAARQGQGRGATGSHGESSTALEKGPSFAQEGPFGPVFSLKAIASESGECSCPQGPRPAQVHDLGRSRSPDGVKVPSRRGCGRTCSSSQPRL
jgi:hypothetical protein